VKNVHKKDREKEEEQSPAGMSIGKLKIRSGGEDYIFDLTTNYKRESREYEAEITMPKSFTVDDFDVSLHNSILTIRVKKESSSESKNNKMFSHNSFYQSFSIPKTKAGTKDVKKEVIGGKLKLTIPIVDSVK
jgi:HSP20 family molecular chaperone IbpA